jgi:hypothetical protein
LSNRVRFIVSFNPLGTPRRPVYLPQRPSEALYNRQILSAVRPIVQGIGGHPEDEGSLKIRGAATAQAFLDKISLSGPISKI